MTATVEKVLGQSYPSAASLTDLYTVPAATSTVVTSMIVCNQSATATTFSITVAPAGAVDIPAHYQYCLYSIDGTMTIRLDNLRWTLATTDKIRVYSTLQSLSFTAFGSERSL